MVLIKSNYRRQYRYDYDAFGNAIGNSIVRAGATQSRNNEIKESIDKAVANGATPQQATQQALEEQGVVFGGGDKGNRSASSSGRTVLGGEFDDNGDLTITRFHDGQRGESGQFDFSRIRGGIAGLDDLQNIHSGILDFAGEHLSTNNNLLNLSRGFYNARVEQGRIERAVASNQRQAYLSERYRIGNAQAAADFNAIGVSGFNVDLNDDAIRLSVATGIAAKTKDELTNLSLNVALAPTLLVGGFALGTRVGLSGLSGAAANVTATNLIGLYSGEDVSINDQFQSFNTGFIGGVVGDRFGGRTGAALGGFSAEVANQFLSQDLNVPKLLLAPAFSFGAQHFGDKAAGHLGSTKFGVGGGLFTTKFADSVFSEGLDSLQRTGLNSIGGVGIDLTIRGTEKVNNASKLSFERQQQKIQFQLENNLFIMPDPARY